MRAFKYVHSEMLDEKLATVFISSEQYAKKNVTQHENEHNLKARLHEARVYSYFFLVFIYVYHDFDKGKLFTNFYNIILKNF